MHWRSQEIGYGKERNAKGKKFKKKIFAPFFIYDVNYF